MPQRPKAQRRQPSSQQHGDDAAQDGASSIDDLLKAYHTRNELAAADALMPSPVAAAEALVELEPTEMSDEDIASIEKKCKEEVAKLEAEKGEAAVQSMLQQQIQKTKKKESEIAVSKKKCEAGRREIDALNEELSKINQRTSILKIHCKTIGEDTEKLAQDRGSRASEMAQKRLEVKLRIETEMTELTAKMDTQKTTNDEIRAENDVLREKFTGLKKEFDDAFENYENSWKVKETESKSVNAELNNLVMKNQLLEVQVIQSNKVLRGLQERIEGYKQQLELYQDKFDDFEGAALRANDVTSIASKQREMFTSKIDDVKKSKQDAMDKKVAADKETQALRQQHQQLKRKLIVAEKATKQAEKKARDAAAKIKK